MTLAVHMRIADSSRDESRGGTLFPSGAARPPAARNAYIGFLKINLLFREIYLLQSEGCDVKRQKSVGAA
jgi:hypothetical protein